MKKALIIAMFCLFFTACSLNHKSSTSQNSSSTNKQTEGLSAKQMEALWEQAGKPSKNHALLNPFVGKWKTEMKCWMDPSGKPQVSTGTSESKWILGGRFLQETFQGKTKGKAFSGMGLTGFDNASNVFTSVWVDSMNTMMGTSTGTASADGKTITFFGSYKDPATSDTVKTKLVLSRINNTKNVLHMYQVNSDGSESMMMQVTYSKLGTTKTASAKSSAAKPSSAKS